MVVRAAAGDAGVTRCPRAIRPLVERATGGEDARREAPHAVASIQPVDMSHADEGTRASRPDRASRGTQSETAAEDGPLGPRVCPWQHEELLRLARGQPRAVRAGRTAGLDLRRLPRRQHRSDRQCQGHGLDPDPRPRPDRRRQPGARPHPAGAVDGQRRQGLRPARRHHRADDGADHRGLRAELRAGRRCRRRVARGRTGGDEGGPQAHLEGSRPRADRGHDADHSPRTELLAARARGAGGGRRALRHRCGPEARDGAQVPRGRCGDRGGGRGLLGEGLQFTRAAPLRGARVGRRQEGRSVPRRHQGGGASLGAAPRRRGHAGRPRSARGHRCLAPLAGSRRPDARRQGARSTGLRPGAPAAGSQVRRG